MKPKIILLAGLVLAGCVPSWNPLYTEKDLAFDPLLVGKWQPVDRKEGSLEKWAFSKTADKQYQLDQTDQEGRTAIFTVCLVKLGDNRFLDLYLTKLQDDGVNLNSWAGFSLVPAHLILKIEAIDSNLKIAAMNPDWVKKFVKQNPQAIEHRVLPDDNIVLTANTSQLQKFVVAHVKEEGLFGDAMTFKRE